MRERAFSEAEIEQIMVKTPARVLAFPDLPTVAEAGVPGYEITTWYGIWAPRGTPAAIVDRLQQAVAAAEATPEMRARLDALGAQPVADTPAAFARFVQAEYDRWGRLVHDANIRMD